MRGDLFDRCVIWKDFAVNACFANAAGYELCILRTEVEYDDGFVMIDRGQER